jgi:3-hydroxyacyl-[acyl-carrier-protein] dehydratase
MAASLFLELDSIDLTKTTVDHDAIYAHLPHRYEFMQLDRIIHIDEMQQLAVAVREVREDEFWVKGHIPGRPIFPGVLMLESAAQMASFLSNHFQPDDRFLGFGGVDGVKFRGAVTPPSTLYFIMKVVELRKRRTVADVQGVINGTLVFEGRITGMPV